MVESLLNKVAGLQACNLIKKSLQHRYFPVDIAKCLRTPILKNICGRLLLSIKDTLGKAFSQTSPKLNRIHVSYIIKVSINLGNLLLKTQVELFLKPLPAQKFSKFTSGHA